MTWIREKMLSMEDLEENHTIEGIQNTQFSGVSPFPRDIEIKLSTDE